LRIARRVKAAGAQVLRGGAFKPRTSPYSFQGLGLEGLKILRKASEETGLPVVTEAVDVQSLELVSEYADIVQLGARNMQNFSLLQAAGRQKKPVMLKRGLSATIEEWLQAAEYILDAGNDRVMLCERGIRSFDNATRNMLDLSAVIALQLQSHLPVVVDPSHGTGRRPMVVPMARAAAAAGAHGVMIDVHDRPKEALCDGPQAIAPEDLERLVPILRGIESAVKG
jgi:3-deoxy-7-phosphoheptulonate synthase